MAWIAVGLLLTALALWAAAIAAMRRGSLAARVVGVAQPFLPAALLVAAAVAIDRGPAHALVGSTRTTVGTLLVVGWIGLTVLGSLLHLLAVVVRVRGGFEMRMPAPRPRLDMAVAAAAAAGVGLTALAQGMGLDDGWQAIGRLLMLAAYAAVGTRIAILAARVLTRARPSI